MLVLVLILIFALNKAAQSSFWFCFRRVSTSQVSVSVYYSYVLLFSYKFYYSQVLCSSHSGALQWSSRDVSRTWKSRSVLLFSCVSLMSLLVCCVTEVAMSFLVCCVTETAWSFLFCCVTRLLLGLLFSTLIVFK